MPASPFQLAPRAGTGPLEATLAGGDGLQGQKMAVFDLAIADEAHGTAGALRSPWAAIASMAHDPEGAYGAWLAELGLAGAIERERVADWWMVSSRALDTSVGRRPHHRPPRPEARAPAA